MQEDAKSNEMLVAETESVVFKKSLIHGTGGFAKHGFRKGTQVIEYVGERISKAESLVRCEQNNEYIFTLNDTEDLDGSVDWNPARFINHSCLPNCDAEEDGEHVWIVANRDIEEGEELTFNYNYDLEDYQQHPCCCGASNCVGYIVAEELFEHVRKRQHLSRGS
jgi:SET domain-containing protein